MGNVALRQPFAIASLSAAIGMPAAFFTIALPTFMRDGGASLMEIGLTWLVWLPSAAKWLWAPAIGRMAFRSSAARTRWLFGLCLALALCFLPVAGLAGSMAIWPLLGLSLISCMIGVTLQMVLAGWQMATLTEAERARMNGWSVAGMVIGGVIGAGLMPIVAVKTGWPVAVPALAALMIISGLPAGWLKGEAKSAVETTTFASFAKVLRAPGRGPLLLLIFLLAGSAGADMSIPARLIDSGLPPEQVLMLLGTVATLLTVPAGLLAGFAMSRWGWPMVLAGLLLVKAAIYLLLAFAPGVQAILGVSDFVLAGALTVAIWQCYMAASRGIVPVTHYGVLTSVDAAIRFCAGLAAGAVATASGYAGMFSLFAGMSVAAALLILIGQRAFRH